MEPSLTVGVAIDGVFGPVTLRAVVAAVPEVIIDRLARARRAFYDHLVQRDPAQAGFLRGCQRRVTATSHAAMVLLQPHAAGPTTTPSSSEAVATTALNSG